VQHQEECLWTPSDGNRRAPKDAHWQTAIMKERAGKRSLPEQTEKSPAPEIRYASLRWCAVTALVARLPEAWQGLEDRGALGVPAHPDSHPWGRGISLPSRWSPQSP